MAEYSYNAWGKVLSATGTLAGDNPLRYRGYVYDTDLCMYYLNSRYYDPEICRFINADDTSLIGANGDLASFNLFVYCLNNPINRSDDSGNISLPNWAKIAIGTTIIVGLAVASVFTCGTAAAICGAALYGAVIGGASGAVIGAVGGGISDGWQGVLDGACSGFMSGTIIGGITGAASAGANISAGTTTVVGKAHASTLHKLATNIEAGKMAASGQYSKIGLNRSLNTMGLNGTQRPDAIGINPNGVNRLVEIVSPKQHTSDIVGKMANMLSNNPGSNGRIVTWVRKLYKVRRLFK